MSKPAPTLNSLDMRIIDATGDAFCVTFATNRPGEVEAYRKHAAWWIRTGHKSNPPGRRPAMPCRVVVVPYHDESAPPAVEEVEAAVAEYRANAEGEQDDAAPVLAPSDSSLTRDSSWVVVRKATGEAVLETFNPELAAAINRDAYDVVPVLEWLQGLNRAIRAASA